jgi:transcriptional regulator with XRE-family HTH domain
MRQEQLAKKAGLDSSYVSLLESGKRTASPEAISAIAKALGSPLEVLQLLGADEAELRGIKPAQARDLGLALAAAVLRSEQA